MEQLENIEINLETELSNITSKVKGKVKEMIEGIIKEHKELREDSDKKNKYGMGYSRQNAEFYNQIMKVFVSGGEFEGYKYSKNTRIEKRLKKLMAMYQPKNASKSDKPFHILHCINPKSNSNKFKKQKFMRDLQHKLLMDMRNELKWRIQSIERENRRKNRRLKRKGAKTKWSKSSSTQQYRKSNKIDTSNDPERTIYSRRRLRRIDCVEDSDSDALLTKVKNSLKGNSYSFKYDMLEKRKMYEKRKRYNAVEGFKRIKVDPFRRGLVNLFSSEASADDEDPVESSLKEPDNLVSQSIRGSNKSQRRRFSILSGVYQSRFKINKDAENSIEAGNPSKLGSNSKQSFRSELRNERSQMEEKRGLLKQDHSKTGKKKNNRFKLSLRNRRRSSLQPHLLNRLSKKHFGSSVPKQNPKKKKKRKRKIKQTEPKSEASANHKAYHIVYVKGDPQNIQEEANSRESDLQSRTKIDSSESGQKEAKKYQAEISSQDLKVDDQRLRTTNSESVPSNYHFEKTGLGVDDMSQIKIDLRKSQIAYSETSSAHLQQTFENGQQPDSSYSGLLSKGNRPVQPQHGRQNSEINDFSVKINNLYSPTGQDNLRSNPPEYDLENYESSLIGPNSEDPMQTVEFQEINGSYSQDPQSTRQYQSESLHSSHPINLASQASESSGVEEFDEEEQTIRGEEEDQTIESTVRIQNSDFEVDLGSSNIDSSAKEQLYDLGDPKYSEDLIPDSQYEEMPISGNRTGSSFYPQTPVLTNDGMYHDLESQDPFITQNNQTDQSDLEVDPNAAHTSIEYSAKLNLKSNTNVGLDQKRPSISGDQNSQSKELQSTSLINIDPMRLKTVSDSVNVSSNLPSGNKTRTVMNTRSTFYQTNFQTQRNREKQNNPLRITLYSHPEDPGSLQVTQDEHIRTFRTKRSFVRPSLKTLKIQGNDRLSHKKKEVFLDGDVKSRGISDQSSQKESEQEESYQTEKIASIASILTGSKNFIRIPDDRAQRLKLIRQNLTGLNRYAKFKNYLNSIIKRPPRVKNKRSKSLNYKYIDKKKFQSFSKDHQDAFTKLFNFRQEVKAEARKEKRAKKNILRLKRIVQNRYDEIELVNKFHDKVEANL